MNKNLPVIIIGLVLIAAIVGGYFLYSRPTTPPKTNTNSGTNTPKPTAGADVTQNLVGTPGAQPAWTRGNPNAAVTIEEFADFACPACASFHNVLKDIKNTYGDRVKITYRHFPLEIRGHENSYTASRATEAAGEQGKFWEMQDMIFTKQREWQFNPEAGKTYEEYAKTLGLDVAKFSDDMRGQKVIARIADDRKRGMAVPVSSTPTVLINGRLATQDEILKPELLKQAIDALLQKTAPAAAAPTAANTGSGAAANSAANANK